MVKLYVYKLDFKEERAKDKCDMLDHVVFAVQTLDGYISKLLPIILGKLVIEKAYENKVICHNGVWWMFTSNPDMQMQDIFLKSINKALKEEQAKLRALQNANNSRLDYIGVLRYNASHERLRRQRIKKENKDEN